MTFSRVYSAAGIAERQLRLRIFGEDFRLRAEVATIGGLSAHAGQELLVGYALATKERVKRIYLVHGEEKSAEALPQPPPGRPVCPGSLA